MKRVFVTAVLAVLSYGTYADAESLIVECKSKSGLSKYNLVFDFSNMIGLIRYRFMEQDITYRASLDKNTSEEVRGQAKFESSRTGEIRGNSFSFQYLKKEKKFRELNVTASCK